MPQNWGKNTTLIAGLSLVGVQAPFILEGAVDTLTLEIYVEQILAPSLKPGQVVVLDNLSVHKGERVRQAIEAKGCQVLFLPAYSLELTPIEKTFSKLKAWLRRQGSHTQGAGGGHGSCAGADYRPRCARLVLALRLIDAEAGQEE